MKYLALLIFAFLVVGSVKSEEEEFREEYCKTYKVESGQCYGVKCNKNETAGYNEACPLSLCPEGQEAVLVREEDASKPYPECCRISTCRPRKTV